METTFMFKTSEQIPTDLLLAYVLFVVCVLVFKAIIIETACPLDKLDDQLEITHSSHK